MKDPKEQKSRFDYDKIKFKFDKLNLHPITQQPIFRKEHKNWGFDYFNEHKCKHYVSNDKLGALNTNLRRAYDPITNRYFN